MGPSPPSLQTRTSTHPAESSAAVFPWLEEGEDPGVAEQKMGPRRPLQPPDSGADLNTSSWGISSSASPFRPSSSHHFYSRVQCSGQGKDSETAGIQGSDPSLGPRSATSPCVVLDKLFNPPDRRPPCQTNEDTTHYRKYGRPRCSAESRC